MKNEAEKSLLTAFDRIKEALISSDVDSLREMIAEDYCGFDPKGDPGDRGLILEAYAPGMTKLDKYDVEDIETRIVGEIGIISGKGYIAGSWGEIEFSHDLRFIDVYVKREESWKLYLSQVTPLSGK
jgi:hypothetical protein